MRFKGDGPLPVSQTWSNVLRMKTRGKKSPYFCVYWASRWMDLSYRHRKCVRLFLLYGKRWALLITPTGRRQLKAFYCDFAERLRFQGRLHVPRPSKLCCIDHGGKDLRASPKRLSHTVSKGFRLSSAWMLWRKQETPHER
jgi:hypothetical protein